MYPDSSWQGPIAFHELLFGTWLSYILLVLLWEKLLKQPLQEWKYLILTCMAASFFLVNHYLFFAPLYLWIINAYTLTFLVVWYRLGMADAQRSVGWKIGAVLCAMAYSVLYVLFEMSARQLMEMGLHEFWITACVFAGFGGVILWRGRKT
jgi:hypothetical protein